MLPLALLPACAGALLELWLFLADTQHVVRLYQGQPQA